MPDVSINYAINVRVKGFHASFYVGVYGRSLAVALAKYPLGHEGVMNEGPIGTNVRDILPGRPQGIAPTIHAPLKPLRCIVGAIPCGRPGGMASQADPLTLVSMGVMN